MDSCEVLVVGGGPAGSTCAGRLREKGVDVLLLDSQTFPRDKPCAGWITPQVLETLGITPEEYRRGRVLQEIDGFATSVLKGAVVKTRYPRTVSYGVRRREFDNYLLERGAVRRVLGEAVVSLERQGEHWIVNNRYRCRLVVGAGGHFCPVARLLGARIGAEEVIVAQAAEFAAGAGDGREGTLGDLPELIFSRDMRGYGWIFRKGEFLNVGFGIIGKSGFRCGMAEFRAHLEGRGVVKSGAAAGFTGHAYLPYRSRGGRRLVGDGLLLIGDAAGFANPRSGEGILQAIESALMAGQT
ncbi:MAG TPA: NAD(P)/FAD-dependent oxidoreductase, partial [Desulfuromonadaceae bacterium]